MNRTNLIAGLVAALVMVVAVFAFSGDDRDLGVGTTATSSDNTATSSDNTATSSDNTATSSDNTQPGQTSVVDSAPATIQRFSDLPTVTLEELPIEALDTLVLIGDGGPYPYRQDDGVFQNREEILPDRPSGHYREYTVDTPGSPDRGARRIVAGNDGERYYTDDHYDSFREILFEGDQR